VQLIFYTYTPLQGYTYYNPINMDKNQANLLGISPDSIYYNIDTSLCFILPDNVVIAMGGYNTSQ
jgi:hypothetical protein